MICVPAGDVATDTDTAGSDVVGCYIVQHQINLRPSEIRSNQVPYMSYYELTGKNDAKSFLGENIKYV